jgi:MOSC domain-containing protein YiiM
MLSQMEKACQILAIYLSPGHNFFGRHNKPPLAHGIVSVTEAECIAGGGLVGDRFFEHKPGYKGQITFFSQEVFDSLRTSLELNGKDPSVLRRNVITRGIDLNALIGKVFSIQGVQFEGTEECRPCYWMDTALAPGAETSLKGRGGLRAKILKGGTLRVDG